MNKASRSECPNELVRRAFAKGSLASTFAEEISLHVAQCSVCAKELFGPGQGTASMLSMHQIESVLKSDEARRVAQVGIRFQRGAGEVSSSALATDLSRIDRYEISRFIGNGSFGAVYKAYDPLLKTDVAIKLSNSTSLAGRRFFQEASTVVKLDHKNIVRVLNAGQLADGRCFIVFELIAGLNLREMVERSHLKGQELYNILCAVLDGVSHAHQRGVIHRDLKPTNILVSADGGVKVADFGLSIDGDSTEAALRIAGTLQYMSPEQLRGDLDSIDARADIFSLGVMVREFSSILAKDVRQKRGLESVVERCCASDISRRFSSVSALKHELDRCLVSSAQRHSRLAIPTRIRKWATPKRLLAALVLVAALSGLFVAYWMDSTARRAVKEILALDKERVPSYIVPTWTNRRWFEDRLRDELTEVGDTRDRNKVIFILSKTGGISPSDLVERITREDTALTELLLRALAAHPDREGLVSELQLSVSTLQRDSRRWRIQATALYAIGVVDAIAGISNDPDVRTGYIYTAPEWLEPDAVDYLIAVGITRVADSPESVAALLAAMYRLEEKIDSESLERIRRDIRLLIEKAGHGSVVSICALWMAALDDPSFDEICPPVGEDFFRSVDGQLMIRVAPDSRLYMSNCEVGLARFRRFLELADIEIPNACDSAEVKYDKPGFPAYSIPRFAAIEYCNYLSRQEGRDEAYKRVGTKQVALRNAQYQVPIHERIEEANGYRLPTQQELEAVAMISEAGSFVGSHEQVTEEILRVFVNYRFPDAMPCFSLLPTAGGFFHVLGNMFEYCHRDEASSELSFFGGCHESPRIDNLFQIKQVSRGLDSAQVAGFRVVCPMKSAD